MMTNANWHERNEVNVKETHQYKTNEMKQEADSTDRMMPDEMSDQ